MTPMVAALAGASMSALASPVFAAIRVTETHILDWPGMSEAERLASLEALRSRIPAGCIVSPKEIAEAALFLGSAASSYMLGGELRLDGGRTTP